MKLTESFAVVVVLLLVWSIYRAHRSGGKYEDFNLFDLLMENGRVSRLACAFWVGHAVMSWAFLRLTLDGKMSDGVFMAYGAVIVTPIIAKLFTNPPAEAPAVAHP